MKILVPAILALICLVAVSGTPRKMRSRRPTKARVQVVIPPIDCVQLYENSIDVGDEGPKIRKTQHNEDCKKYYECVTNHWIARDCPQGTTFNLDDKNCDLEKTCKPSIVKDLYEEGVERLKSFLGLGEPKDF